MVEKCSFFLVSFSFLNGTICLLVAMPLQQNDSVALGRSNFIYLFLILLSNCGADVGGTCAWPCEELPHGA